MDATTGRGHGMRQRRPSGFLLHRFLVEDGGQDLIEYALITGFIGIMGYVVLDLIGVGVFNAYSSWITPASGVPSLWDPAEPVGSTP